MDVFLEKHSGELLIFILALILFVTLLILVPQLLRAHQRTVESQHAEHMLALEKGQLLPKRDEAARAAGRTAALVPMVTICAAGTVTCFVAASKSENLFAVTLTVWSVAGLVSLAAVTGGVALLGRLAQLNASDELEEAQAEARK
jgi:hypothetical protein